MPRTWLENRSEGGRNVVDRSKAALWGPECYSLAVNWRRKVEALTVFESERHSTLERLTLVLRYRWKRVQEEDRR